MSENRYCSHNFGCDFQWAEARDITSLRCTGPFHITKKYLVQGKSSTKIKKPALRWLMSPSIGFHRESHVSDTNEWQPPDVVGGTRKYEYSEEKIIEVWLYRYNILLKADLLAESKSPM